MTAIPECRTRPGRREHTPAACDRLPKTLLSPQAALPNLVTESLELSGTFRGGFPSCLFNVAEKSFYFALHEIGLHA